VNRAALVACTMVAVIAGTTFAGPFEDGVAAYNRGDYATAMQLWQPLADRGDTSAQNNLGVMYERDEGVPQDYVRAHMWFSLAAAQRVQTAAEGRDRVAKRMTPAQIAEAQKLAREWQPTTQPSRPSQTSNQRNGPHIRDSRSKETAPAGRAARKVKPAGQPAGR
jgi:TPR repeat protein